MTHDQGPPPCQSLDCGAAAESWTEYTYCTEHGIDRRVDEMAEELYEDVLYAVGEELDARLGERDADVEGLLDELRSQNFNV